MEPTSEASPSQDQPSTAIPPEPAQETNTQPSPSSAAELVDRIIPSSKWAIDQLNLSDPARKVLHIGEIAHKPEGLHGWSKATAILLDNYLILAKPNKLNDAASGEAVWKLDASTMPVPLSTRVPSRMAVLADAPHKVGFMDDFMRGQYLFVLDCHNDRNDKAKHRKTRIGFEDHGGLERWKELLKEAGAVVLTDGGK